MALSTFLPIWHIQKHFTAECSGDCLYTHPTIVRREQVTWPRIAFSANRHLLTPLALLPVRWSLKIGSLILVSSRSLSKNFWYFTDFIFAKLFRQCSTKKDVAFQTVFSKAEKSNVSMSLESLLVYCQLCLCQPAHRSRKCWTLLNTAETLMQFTILAETLILLLSLEFSSVLGHATYRLVSLFALFKAPNLEQNLHLHSFDLYFSFLSAEHH